MKKFTKKAPASEQVRVVPSIEEETHKSAGVYVGYQQGGCGDVATLTLQGHQIVPDAYLERLKRRDEVFWEMVGALKVAQGFVQAVDQKWGFGGDHTLVEINKVLEKVEKL